MSSLRNRTTPGVYITELPAFGNSVVGVATAIPIFVGYTEYARNPSSGKPVYMQAIAIGSLADYYSYFGYEFNTKYFVELATDANYDFQAIAADGTLQNYVVTMSADSPQFNLFNAIRLFYANGGGDCYVVSVADYGGGQGTTTYTGDGIVIAADPALLVAGLEIAKNTINPTMVVVPDACLLEYGADTANGSGSPYSAVVSAMIQQSSDLQSRVAIVDLPGAVDPTNWNTAGLETTRERFYEAISGVSTISDVLSYGAAYAPALEVSVLGTSDVDFTNLYGPAGTTAGIILMNQLLNAQAASLFAAGSTKLKQVQTNIETAYPASGTAPTLTATEITSVNNYLKNALPLMGQTLEILLDALNVAPPSGVMAGLWTTNDATRGVWNAPANMTPLAVVAPKVILTDDDQSDYNVPLNGESISILRKFPSRGTVVWGARTLDGNSNDYRYIQVRRTLIYVEQSIKTAIQPFVFAANTGQTWVTVTSLISNFLTGLWTQGGLVGDKASSAFSVQCGLGSTMTAQDILNGYMIVSVQMAMVHPAEFIELTFTQQLQTA